MPSRRRLWVPSRRPWAERSSLLAPFEKTLRYNAQIGVRAAKARKKNAKQAAEAAAAAEAEAEAPESESQPE